MRAVIDRFEGDFAVIELDDGGFSNLPKELVPGAKEGDIVIIKVESGESETQKRQTRLRRLFSE